MSKTVLLSAGGTGGHVMPAVALARALRARGCRVEVATDKRGEKFIPFFEDAPAHVLAAGTMGAGLAGKIKGMAALAQGIAQAFNLLVRLKPDIVVGFGGYPSFPAMFAAQSCKIKTVVHEQNAVLGWANDILAPRATRIALSFPLARMKKPLDPARMVLTGNPVRAEVAVLGTRPYPAPAPGGTFHLFIVGGSLGAGVLSKVVPAALSSLPEAERARLDVVQQCRAEDIEAVRALYQSAGIKARLDSFFSDVPDILACAHLVIARSGASTVAENAAAGRPALYVPAGYHADNQQHANADSIAARGGAWVMAEADFTPVALAALIGGMMAAPEKLAAAALAARSCGVADAAERLADLVLSV